MALEKITIRNDNVSFDAEVVQLEKSPLSSIKQVINKRIAYADMKAGVSPGSVLRFDDSAYQAIYDLTKGNIGLSLDVTKMLLPTDDQLSHERPYVVNGEMVRNLGLTFEILEANYDSPSKNAEVIRVKPWWEC
jgi:hypothetical protein